MEALSAAILVVGATAVHAFFLIVIRLLRIRFILFSGPEDHI
jgi:hypothetical protein